MSNEAVPRRVDAEFIKAASDPALVGEAARRSAQVIDAATDSGQVGPPRSVLNCQLPTKPPFHLDNENFGDGVDELVVPLTGQDFFALFGAQLSEQIRGVDQQEPQAANRDMGCSLAKGFHGLFLVCQAFKAVTTASALARSSNQYSYNCGPICVSTTPRNQAVPSD